MEEQLQSGSPKKTRLKNALTGIKGFAEKMAINAVTGSVVAAAASIDWATLIKAIEKFIQM